MSILQHTPNRLKLELSQQDGTLRCILETMLPRHPRVVFAKCMQPQPQERTLVLTIQFTCPLMLHEMLTVVRDAVLEAKRVLADMACAYRDALEQVLSAQ